MAGCTDCSECVYKSIRSIIIVITSPPLPSPPLPSGVVDVAAEWMSDLKEGWCPNAGYYNREACCWLSNDTLVDVESQHCAMWSEWSHVYNISTGGYVFDYFIYVLLAVVFAGLAGLFVTTLAPYASGSGIPEVRQFLIWFCYRNTCAGLSWCKSTLLSMV